MKLTKIILIGILLLASLLRFYKIDQVPHGLYIDEVSIGYNAYTILTTGKDEHGVTYPLFFQAFGEYKMPVEIYLTSFSMAVFGKNEFAVRFPSALFGSLTVLLLYFLVKLLIRKECVALLSAFLLAVTPWHIQFSRAGFEANTALFFYLLGGVLFLYFLNRKRFLWLVLSSLFFVVAAYTYNAYKLIVPVTLVFMVPYVIPNLFRNPKEMLKQVQHDKVKFGMTLLIIVFLLLPLFLFSGGNARFLETSAFSESRSVLAYPMIYLQNYLSFFSLPFLFVTGDGIGRHTIVGMGPLFRWELPFLMVGLFFLFKERKTRFAQVLFFLLLIAPTTAALTRPSPHLLRSFLLVIPLTVLVSYGLGSLWEKKSKVLKILIILIGFLAVYEFGYYLHFYYIHYPIRTAPDWGSEYKAVIMGAAVRQKDYDAIVINNKLGMVQSYINFYDPKLSYQLVDPSWQKPKDSSQKILYITTSGEKDNPGLQTTPHKHIQDISLHSAYNGIFAQFWEL